MHKSSMTCSRFPTWLGQWMGPTYHLWHPDCILQITITAKVFILFFCKALYRPNVYFGISILIGRVRCTMPTFGAGRQSASIARLGSSTLILWWGMQLILVVCGCSHPLRVTRAAFRGRSTIGILSKVSPRMCVERAFGMLKGR